MPSIVAFAADFGLAAATFAYLAAILVPLDLVGPDPLSTFLARAVNTISGGKLAKLLVPGEFEVVVKHVADMF